MMNTKDKVKPMIVGAVGAMMVVTSIAGAEESSGKAKKPVPNPIIAPVYDWGTQASLPPSGFAFPDPSSVLPFDLGSLPKGPTAPAGNQGNDIAIAQKQFDLFSWATFIGLNWPAGKDGNPQETKIGGDKGATRVWEHYMAPQDFFKKNGKAPNAWGQPQDEVKDLPFISKDPHVLNELDEAFFNLETPMPSITDLNNEYVRYEVRFNKEEYDYMYPFHTKEKQAEFIAKGGKFEFPVGESASGDVPGKMGAMELKVAWKKMGPGDDLSKFYTINASYEDSLLPNGGVKGHGVYGMVGMHIAVRTKSASQWVWATFEHVDNTPRVTIPFTKGDKQKVDGKGKKYSFWNEDGVDSITGFDSEVYGDLVALEKTREAKDKNQSGNYYQDKDKREPSQIAQVITDNNNVVVSEWTETLNQTMQGKLKGTVWENYRLVSTQWPSNPDAETPTGYKVPLGVPVPVSLGNPVMETYLQVNGSCMGCHAGATTELDGDNTTTNFSFMLQRASSVKPNPIQKK